ncbi:alpha/beta hydrolase [Nocardia ignorata]|uniref:S-formylglutathione hydrolase FrmB n=1 Tax=Nocardia ignorata TaxID=145285 RepID=A0A4R6PVH4_NOCIG|nr:alpha/beta hydrolase family protein [Nocardia ignorata]TDP42130.1 S-formylglutathione hydrolase FrmB [Nocardia ignorata]
MRRLLCCLLVLLGCGVVVSPAASANSSILEVRPLGGRQFEVVVHSAAMNRPITLWMSHPGPGAPALYLLNAVDGGESGGPWMRRTDVVDFFADKPVNVIVPIGGRASMYTDWQRDDPVLGRNKWTTFLTSELPPLLDDRFGMTGANGVAGLSMSATSALNLAIAAPGRYRAVGALSGCTQTANPLAQTLVRSQLATFGANADNMWGGPGDPAWVANDPVLHADRLRGTSVYLSSGNGAPGPHEALNDPSIAGNVGVLLDRVLVGGTMEAVVGSCSGPLAGRLGQLGIPADVRFRAAGTHAWPYWQDDVHDSWPMFAAALGV